VADRRHSVVREGLITGLIGGTIVAAWYLAVDLGGGRPLHTPNVLGQVFTGDTIPAVERIVPLAVAEYSLLHFGVFFLLGIALTALAHLAQRNPAFRMGVWLGLMISFLAFLGLLLLLYTLTDQRFPWFPAVLGGILGIGTMGWFVWRRHRQLRTSFNHAPLGAEVEAPPHPQSGPAQ
jgi:hypothetical protein